MSSNQRETFAIGHEAEQRQLAVDNAIHALTEGAQASAFAAMQFQHDSRCDSNYCGHRFESVAQTCGLTIDSELHYAGTVDSHVFKAQSCSCAVPVPLSVKPEAYTAALRRIKELEEQLAQREDSIDRLNGEIQGLREVNNELDFAAKAEAKEHGALRHTVESALRLTGHLSLASMALEAKGHRLPTYDLVSHLWRQMVFSSHAFGPGMRTEGVIAHIRKELIEIAADPLDVEEWIDVVLLAIDGAWRCAAHGNDVPPGDRPDVAKRVVFALAAKLDKNERRKWPDWRTADTTGPIEHVREP